ncbi:OsmC family protein [Pontibacter sp. E15-1]|uniref:OsmC family protein n=1 Tax=Pontibacter sp. E15-1 TaxID=2919918 RepID=UPI001F502950|nr:OsmC family protein [Pontibacter sp. E15-1]MCJ8166626.1 OsmC family protein [Pontibacter sp. E15-1]
MNSNEQAATVTVSADSSAPMIANIQAGGKAMVLDESSIETGIKAGPDPYDYIMSALGACTVITLHMYARRKGWPLERAEVTLQHGRVHAKDCESCEDDVARISQVTKRLRLTGDLSVEQRARLKLISAKCPVQKTLAGGIAIETELLED